MKYRDSVLKTTHTTHQRKKVWPRRCHMPQRIQQEWDDCTPVWHQPTPPPLFFLLRCPFNTSTQNSFLHLLPVLHCPTPQAHGKKNTTLFHQMPDSYQFWHAHEKTWKKFWGKHLYADIYIHFYKAVKRVMKSKNSDWIVGRRFFSWHLAHSTSHHLLIRSEWYSAHHVDHH